MGKVCLEDDLAAPAAGSNKKNTTSVEVSGVHENGDAKHVDAKRVDGGTIDDDGAAKTSETLGIKSIDEKNGEMLSDGDDSDSSSESESESSSSSSSAVSSSSEEEDDEEDDDDEKGASDTRTPTVEVKFLPPVPRVNVRLRPHHQTLPVGMVQSIFGSRVIVEGMEKHDPLNVGSIVWITENRSLLGRVDEIFGPVKNPYYVVRYNWENGVPAVVKEGTLVSFVTAFANHVLNNSCLYNKGYNATGENDEELWDEVEFSHDEEEAAYNRMLKVTKRGIIDRTIGSKKARKKFKNWGGTWKNSLSSYPRIPWKACQLPMDQRWHGVPTHHANC